MKTEDIAQLAAALSAGIITENYITKHYGNSVLSSVLGIAGAGIAGVVASSVTSTALQTLNDHTGLVDVADSLISSLNPFD